MFDKLTSPELSDFIWAHDPNVLMKKDIPSNKGKLEDAKYAVKHSSTADKNRIFTAFMCRDKPNKLILLQNTSPTNEIITTNDVGPTVVSFSGTVDHDQGDMPSSLLSDEAWIGRVCELFDAEYLIPAVSVTNEMKSKGDLLVKLMRGRLKSLLKKRIETEAKRNHWAIQLAFKNFAIVAAYMILLDHIKCDLTCLDDTMSLLNPNTDRFLLCSTFPQRKGAYLYFDTNLGAFVRSGKVSGRSFSVRHEEHEKKSRERNASSNFYFLYPAQEVANNTMRRRQGVFQSLRQYIAAGFDPTSTAAMNVDKGHNNGGILVLSNNDIKCIQSSMKQQPRHLLKFHAYIAYLFELGYDVAIQPSMNVSSNPGFESFIGVFS
jgi:hypothetical protein